MKKAKPSGINAATWFYGQPGFHAPATEPERAAHTPGPWQVTHKRAYERPVQVREHFAIAPQDGPTFAFLPEGRVDIQEANARLIAAAPRMAELLMSAWQHVSHGGPTRGDVEDVLRQAGLI